MTADAAPPLPSLGHRVATRILEGVATRLWGFAPNLMAVIVEQLGPPGALAWFARNMPRYERTLSAWGPVRTHLASVAISLLNGCPYCTFGHAYAFELVYLREHGRLFPLDEHALVALHHRDEAAILRELEQALAEAELAGERPVLARLMALRDGDPPISQDDRRLAHLLEMFAVLNRCGIAGGVAPDQAHDPANRDRALKERYRRLRSVAS